MMHLNSIVVAILDSKLKSFREYSSERLSNGRKSTVHLPFDSEYQILIKNSHERNIRLDIDIDGTSVTNDGLIVYSKNQCILERFLNSDRKFKFVPISNSEVADPTSKENGIITVKINFENSRSPFTIGDNESWKRWEWTMPFQPSSYPPSYPIDRTAGDTVWMSNMPHSVSSGDNIVCSYHSSLKGSCSSQVTYSCDTIKTRSFASKAGATIEGSKSNQKFTTVDWLGDDTLLESLVFKFQLLGITQQDTEEYKEYLRLKNKFES
jgi:hypothetical protein